MLAPIGAWLTSERGGWTVIVTTISACALWPLVSFDAATFVLSVEAILLGVAVLVYQGSKEARDETRDVAAHAKLDELLRGVPEADEALAGVEERGL